MLKNKNSLAVIAILGMLSTAFPIDMVTTQAANTTVEAAIDTKTAVDVNKLMEAIASDYTASTDPFVIMDLVSYGKKDTLTNTDSFIKDAMDLITSKESNNLGTDLEKTIVALSSLGIDAANIKYSGKWYDAIEVLGQLDMEDELVNSLIFAVNAYDSGEYAVNSKALQNKEELLYLLLDEQKNDGGFTFMGKTGDVDMTAMALHALSTYYMAPNAKTAGITEALYLEIKKSADRAIKFLSDIQNEDGTFSSGGNANSNSSSMVVVALSAFGIDSRTDSRFIKEKGNALDALLTYANEKSKGFKWKNTDNKVNAMATEQGFRALVAYENMKKSGAPFNIYSYGRVRTERPGTSPVPTEKPTEKPIVKPTVEPIGKPTIIPTEKPIVESTVEPTLSPTDQPMVNVTETPTVDTTWKPITSPRPTEGATVNSTDKPTVYQTKQPTKQPIVNAAEQENSNQTEEPTVKPMMVETSASEVVKKPVATKRPESESVVEETDEPKVTNKVDSTEKADSTEKPVESESLEIQKKPVETIKPALVKKPITARKVVGGIAGVGMLSCLSGIFYMIRTKPRV